MPTRTSFICSKPAWRKLESILYLKSDRNSANALPFPSLFCSSKEYGLGKCIENVVNGQSCDRILTLIGIPTILHK